MPLKKTHMNIFKYNDVDIHYALCPAKQSSGSSLTLVFLHNAGTDHSIWLPVREILTEHFDTVVLDWPGYGARRGVPGHYAISDYGQMLSSFLKEMSLGPTVLVGNCLGSGAALEHCWRNKDTNIKSLVLFNILVPQTLGWIGRFFLKWSTVTGGFYEAIRKRISLPKTVQTFMVNYQIKHQSKVPQLAKQHLLVLNASPHNIRNLGSLVASLKKSKYLNTLTMQDSFPPTLIAWGAQNKVLPLSKGKKFIATYQPTTFHTLNGGHLVMLEDPKSCARLILDFIAQNF